MYGREEYGNTIIERDGDTETTTFLDPSEMADRTNLIAAETVRSGVQDKRQQEYDQARRMMSILPQIEALAGNDPTRRQKVMEFSKYLGGVVKNFEGAARGAGVSLPGGRGGGGGTHRPMWDVPEGAIPIPNMTGQTGIYGVRMPDGHIKITNEGKRPRGSAGPNMGDALFQSGMRGVTPQEPTIDPKALLDAAVKAFAAEPIRADKLSFTEYYANFKKAVTGGGGSPQPGGGGGISLPAGGQGVDTLKGSSGTGLQGAPALSSPQQEYMWATDSQGRRTLVPKNMGMGPNAGLGGGGGGGVGLPRVGGGQGRTGNINGPTGKNFASPVNSINPRTVKIMNAVAQLIINNHPNAQRAKNSFLAEATPEQRAYFSNILKTNNPSIGQKKEERIREDFFKRPVPESMKSWS